MGAVPATGRRGPLSLDGPGPSMGAASASPALPPQPAALTTSINPAMIAEGERRARDMLQACNEREGDSRRWYTWMGRRREKATAIAAFGPTGGFRPSRKSLRARRNLRVPYDMGQTRKA